MSGALSGRDVSPWPAALPRPGLLSPLGETAAGPGAQRIRGGRAEAQRAAPSRLLVNLGLDGQQKST